MMKPRMLSSNEKYKEKLKEIRLCFVVVEESDVVDTKVKASLPRVKYSLSSVGPSTCASRRPSEHCCSACRCVDATSASMWDRLPVVQMVIR